MKTTWIYVVNKPSKKKWMQPQSINHMVVNKLALLILGCIVRASTEVTKTTKPAAPAKDVRRTGTEMSFGTNPGKARPGG